MANTTTPAKRPLGIALAACAFGLAAPAADSNTIEIQLTPAGEFLPSDGREMNVAAWRIDATAAEAVIRRFNERKNPAVVDYEHQTLQAETNGQPAPAAAWMRALQWREGSGLWATVELTERAAAYLRSGEYRYVSPVFAYDPETGVVQAVLMAAFTNNPAIQGMAPLELRAAATFGFQTLSDQDNTMNKLLIAICTLLGLDPAKTTEDQAEAACTGIKAQLEQLGKLRTELGVAEGADTATAVAACTSLKNKAAATAPDPTKFAPIEIVTELQGQVAALTAKDTDREVGALVDLALKDGRLLPAMKDWATDLGKKDLAALKSFVDKSAPIAALSATQTGGHQPAGVPDENGLTPSELAVCAATGVAPKDYAATKAATPAA
jgi:phage I-like protein